VGIVAAPFIVVPSERVWTEDTLEQYASRCEPARIVATSRAPPRA
jgi:hypothetical protein